MRTLDKNMTVITGYGKLYLNMGLAGLKKNYNLVVSYKNRITNNMSIMSSFLPDALPPRYAKTI